ncbi:MAG TPA: alkaline phosphatase family protein [Solirubrobacteraceae bacterium]|nr:alkaline phosphatase family protein [Solirubrobacteraceae bacterium]
MITRFVRSRADARDRSGAARGARRRMLGVGAAAVAVIGVGIPLLVSTSAGAHGSSQRAVHARQSWVISSPSGRKYFDNLGVQPGAVKHVWLIILENKSYDASFTGLNNNTYLWQTLPKQGALLKQYFATGHSSQDNYTTLVSGQAPQPDVQDDCTYYNADANAAFAGGAATDNGVDVSGGSLEVNPNYGQWTAAAGPNAYIGNSASHTPTTLGCVYPSSVQTLFNQFDAAGITWKGYAQDLGDTTNSGPTASASASNLTLDENACGAPYDDSSATTWPYANPLATSSTADPNPGSASAGGAYVPKHFPFPWFSSLLDNPKDCNSTHIEPFFDNPGADFYSDLQADEHHPNAYPNFVWITPDNCSDAHDAECVNGSGAASTELNGYTEGGNLSGGFSKPDIPNAPTNGTGGLYAADLFLEHVIPEIESSSEFKDGGLIDVTFDEGYPPYTYNNSFYNDSSSNYLHIQPGASAALATDAAGETLDAHGHLKELTSEPTGPNTPLIQDPTTGEQLSPGPGDAAGLDRPDNCVAQTPTNTVRPIPYNPASQAVGTCVLGPQASTTATDSLSKARTDTSGVSGSSSSSTIQDNAIKITDEGRPVSGTNIPAGAYVGTVADGPIGSCTSPSSCSPSGLNASAVAVGAGGSTGFEEQGYFTLVNSSGNPITPTGAVASVTFAADCDPTPANMGGSSSSCSGLADPYYDATTPTPGGGDTGTVLISPYIKPGTVSTVYYNHYSWLRTMEDLFGVAWSSPGLDGEGHLGYAAQTGLVPFGPDVFTNTSGRRRGQ